MLAGKLARYHHQFGVIEGQMPRLAFIDIDPRLDNVAMLAFILDVEDDGARLIRQTEPVLNARDVIEILLAGQSPIAVFPRIGGKAVAIVFSLGQRVRLRLPLGERAVQILRVRSAHLRQLHIPIALLVHEVGGQVLTKTALAGKRDHGFRPMSLINEERITVSFLSAASIAKAFAPPAPSATRSVTFARTLETYLSGIIAHCRWPLHTSLLEGINNKIKVIKRMAYGFRDDQYFFLKIRAAFPGNPG